MWSYIRRIPNHHIKPIFNSKHPVFVEEWGMDILVVRIPVGDQIGRGRWETCIDQFIGDLFAQQVVMVAVFALGFGCACAKMAMAYLLQLFLQGINRYRLKCGIAVEPDQRIGRNEFCLQVGQRTDTKVIEIDGNVLLAKQRYKKSQFRNLYSNRLYVNTIDTVLDQEQLSAIILRIVFEGLGDLL